ncbi:MAG: hypothetical protein SGI97_04650 [candidate division Zixibacteria bacterium]|nr:hypothetical protein [candidate division Zixibacteria bacterium]
MAEQSGGTAPDLRGKKQRSPNFPVMGLKEAVEKINAIYAKDGNAGSTREAVLKHLGYKGEHGASLTAISALRKFGLTSEENGRIVLTRDALYIVLKGGSEAEKLAALKRCALKPEIYKELWREFAERGGLPGDDTLRTLLVMERGFNPKAVEGFIRDFRQTLDYAGIKAGIKFEAPETRQADQFEGNLMDLNQMPGVRVTPQPATMVMGTAGPQAIITRDYPIPLKGGRTAILRVPYPYKQLDIDKIKKWLDDILSDTIEDAEDIDK